MVTAIGCMSGGLDSTLAVRLMQRLDVEVIGLHILHLWAPPPAESGAKPRAVRAAEALGVPLRTIDAAEADLALVLAPAHGLGKRMNPCIDCRIWSLRRARELMDAERADFVFTGEVLGQRPMSQRRPVMQLIEREAGLVGRLLRPLSAKCLPPTQAEQQGLVDREKLLGIRGRARAVQMALAAEWGITDYPSPAGGCLLTDPGFALRLRDLLARGPPTVADVELLKVGRHFRLPDGTLLVMGRSEQDCLLLDRFFRPGDVRIEAEGIPGPTTLLRGAPGDDNLRTAAALTLRYITKAGPGPRRVLVQPVGGPKRTITAAPAADADARRLIIAPAEGK
ncbi:MAG: tRNA 4-thiouridine(8) synthase ThiI [Planctomycetes bacterium]|nr:tRNA 4-thiouridine(8) synthase ThiI [Planctomycetota bacterium]